MVERLKEQFDDDGVSGNAWFRPMLPHGVDRFWSPLLVSRQLNFNRWNAYGSP